MRANDIPLDDRDRAILRELQADGRLTNLELAQRINLSPSACLRRVPPEQLLEKLRFAMIVCIGEGGSSGRLLYPQVNEFSVTAAEAVNDLPERIRSGQMTEKH